MDKTEACTLGVAQGLTEFLPVSSSGHLTILEHKFGLHEAPVTLNLALHFATLLVIVIYYRKTIFSIFFPFNKKYILALVITSIPTGVIGLLVKSLEDSVFGHPNVSASLLCVNGIYLIALTRLSPKASADQELPTYKQAFFIGIAQGIAALPGISRSGSTIGLSRIMGLPASLAAEYSLIASCPVILGASLLESRKIAQLSELGMVMLSALIAAVTGWIAIKLLLHIARRGSWTIWGIYCIIAGIGFMIFP